MMLLARVAMLAYMALYTCHLFILTRNEGNVYIYITNEGDEKEIERSEKVEDEYGYM